MDIEWAIKRSVGCDSRVVLHHLGEKAKGCLGSTLRDLNNGGGGEDRGEDLMEEAEVESSQDMAQHYDSSDSHSHKVRFEEHMRFGRGRFGE